MPDNAKPAPEVWQPSATIEEVREFAIGTAADSLSAFVNAYRDSWDDGMCDAIRKLRNIATRLDQFRRMKAKQPPGAASPQPTTAQGDE